MNYSEMSDDMINLEVFEILYGRIGEDKYRLRVWQQGKFHPCQSWAYAGPIIEKNRISIVEKAEGWCAEGGGIYPISDNNPRRAAMIVFLMMRDNK